MGGKAGRGGESSGIVDGTVTTKEGAGAGRTGGGRGGGGVGSDGAATATGEPQAAGRGANSMCEPAVTKRADAGSCGVQSPLSGSYGIVLVTNREELQRDGS